MKMNSEPWNVSLSERLRKVLQDDGKKTVVYLYELADTSTFRYRAYNPCQALEYSSTWKGSYFFTTELSTLAQYLNHVDLVVFARIRWSHAFESFFQEVKKHHLPTVFDVDDLVFDVEKIPLIMNTLGLKVIDKDYDNWFSYVSRMWFMGSKCDYTFGTNEFLCKQLREVFDKPSLISNNFLNHEQMSLSQELFQERLSVKPRKGFKIGYFSGSPTHENDFGKISVEIGHLLDSYPEMTLEVVGFMNFPSHLQKHIEKKQITFTPLVDFLTLQKKIADVDVNIVPLIENTFTNCKSELKFFEASIVGTVTCATPTYVFEQNIEHEKTGFLCREGDWMTYLEKIYKNEIAPSMVQQSREYCLNKYSPKSQCALIEKNLDHICK